MGILINTGFDLGSSSPIDNRTIKNTTNERDVLVSEGKVYENLKVYCKDTKKEYRWTGTEWEISSSGGDLTDYQKKTDDTLTTTDKTVVGAINEIYGTQLDTVGFSADYKNIILNRKNGLNPYTIPISAIINNASLTELKDIDSTDIGNGKTLVYDSAIQKHKYVDTELTDELVKMEASSDSEYLADLIDKNTIVNDKGVLKVKKLDGQEVTIAEINYLKGLTMNIVDLVKSFSNGGVKMYEHTIATYADLLALDRSEFVDGIRYFVYVLADETHGGIKTTYICDKTNTSYFGVAGDDRDFTTEPIDLANEVTGKLGASNIDVDALWKLLTINDTYKTLTTNNEVFGTHGAKAMYDELATEIGKKANDTDLTKHTDDTNIHVTKGDKAKWDRVADKVNTLDFYNHKNNTNIHITADERTKWNNVDNKINKTDITTTIDDTSTDDEVPSAKSVFQFVGNGKNKLETAIADKGGIVSKAGEVITFDELESSIKALNVKSGFGQVTNYVKNSSLTTTEGTTVWLSKTTRNLLDEYYLNGRVCQVNSTYSSSLSSGMATYFIALTDTLNVSDIGADTELIGSCWINPSTFKCDNSNYEFRVFVRFQREANTEWTYSTAPSTTFTTIDMTKNQWQRSYAKFKIKDIDNSNINAIRLMLGFKTTGSTSNYTFSGEFKFALPSLIQVSSLQNLPNEKTEIELLQELINN